MLGRDEQMQPGLIDSQDFCQGFGFASRQAIFEAMEFQKTHDMGFHRGCDVIVYTWIH